MGVLSLLVVEIYVSELRILSIRYKNFEHSAKA